MKRAVFITVIVLIVLTIYMCSRNFFIDIKVRKTAEIYLADRYHVSMVYKSIERPKFLLFSDDNYYKVYFSPKNNPEIEFYVKVRSKELKIDADRVDEDTGMLYTSDNYLLRRFKHNMQTYLIDEFTSIGVFEEIVVGLNDYWIRQDVMLVETTGMKEADKLIPYDVYIDIDSLENTDVIAETLLNIFQKLEDLDLNPTSVILSIGGKTDRSYIDFDNWRDIASVVEISEKLKYR